MRPFIKSKNSTLNMMRDLSIALLPIVFFSFYKNGILLYQKGYASFLEMFYPLIFIAIGVLSSMFAEEIYVYIFEGKRDKELVDEIVQGYGFFPGFFLSIILPINTPLSILFMGSAVAIIFGKMIFGGFGKNLFNPALIGCLFIVTCYGVNISANGGYLNAYELDAISKATPLTNISLVEGIGTYDTLVKPYGTLMNFFIGTIPGAVGETSALCCLIGFIYLTLKKTIKWRIPVLYVSTVFIMTFIIGGFNHLGIWYPLFQILSGGLMLGAVFMATDPVTSPLTKYGQIIYGICLGFLTVVLRYLTSYPEGVLTSILIMNMLVFIVDKIGLKLANNFKKHSPYIIVLIVLALFTSFYISTTYSKKTTEVDSSFEIISKKIDSNITIYEVSQKGFGGKIKASIIFTDKKITSINILESKESADRYKLIEDEKYIDKLISSQDKIEDVDTVSSATISSTALKKMVINTITDFNNNKEEVAKKEEVPKEDVTIISSVQDGEMTTYELEVPSFNGNLKMRVVTKGNEIRTVIPLEYNDNCIEQDKASPYYSCPEYMNQGYITELIKNESELDSVDTVSGATISSSAIKKALIAIKKEGSLNE